VKLVLNRLYLLPLIPSDRGVPELISFCKLVVTVNGATVFATFSTSGPEITSNLSDVQRGLHLRRPGGESP
jgi:hypothetical protein